MQNLYVVVKARVTRFAAHLFRSRPLMLLMLFVFLSVQQSFGQAMVENAMNSIKSWIVIILNVAFLIGIAIGIFKAAMKFFTGSPDKVEFMIGIVIAIALFGGFQFIVDDLAAFLGGDILLDDTQG
ncbi:hypothetical protein WJR50_33210 [Catalinimonas sp. 4WD22]|uniref:hypothetical protein n=1 Tax=Catalinimonas locisalis TaxID=3133978 RepID=UPI003101A9E3